MSERVKLSRAMRAVLEKAPENWERQPPNIRQCLPTERALKKRGLIEFQLNITHFVWRRTALGSEALA